MKSSEFLYVANWKMQIPFKKAISFCWNHKDGLESLSSQENVRVVLCPSFDALHLIAQVFINSSLSVGAQNCAAHESGPYTGEVSARSISDIGCEFCILGHSERRSHFLETDELVSKKLQQVLKHGLHPIVCVGETKKQFDAQQTKSVIEAQVSSVCKVVQDAAPDGTVCIAYEPVWAIGTGLVANNQQIEAVFSQIRSIANKMAPNARIILLYGGSVNDQNAQQLKQVADIGGFLIGGASLDFQKFEKIVT